VVENREWVEQMTREERLAIRGACVRANFKTEDNERSWSVWMRPSCRLNFKDFGPQEAALTDQRSRKKAAAEIATEAETALRLMRDQLKSGLFV
jgi:hypothetical protein